MTTTKTEHIDESGAHVEVTQVHGMPTEEDIESTRAAILQKLEAAVELTKRAKFPTAVIFVAAPEFPITADSKIEFVDLIAGELGTARDFLIFKVATFGRVWDETVAQQKPDIPEAPAPEQAG